MTEKRTVCVVLVTYNRKKLLMELLNSICIQTYPVSAVVLVDNHSTDGTAEMLAEKKVISETIPDETVNSRWNNMEIYYFRSSKNTGGSGGFSRAFKIAEKLPYDCVWVMDDDVEPEKNCLEQLLLYLDHTAQVCIPSRQDKNWDDYAITEYNLTNPFLHRLGLMKKRVASTEIKTDYLRVEDMPLEGPLITMSVVKQIGGPDPGYFIMYDDTDYAHRAGELTELRYIPSAILHRKLASHVQQEAVTPPDSTWKDYYLLRNQFYFDRKYGKNVLVKYFRPWWSWTAKRIHAVTHRETYRMHVLNMAYHDAVNHRMGMTVQPGTDFFPAFHEKTEE